MTNMSYTNSYGILLFSSKGCLLRAQQLLSGTNATAILLARHAILQVHGKVTCYVNLFRAWVEGD